MSLSPIRPQVCSRPIYENQSGVLQAVPVTPIRLVVGHICVQPLLFRCQVSLRPYQDTYKTPEAPPTISIPPPTPETLSPPQRSPLQSCHQSYNLPSKLPPPPKRSPYKMSLSLIRLQEERYAVNPYMHLSLSYRLTLFP